MKKSLFSSSRLKVKRANKHIKELNRIIIGFNKIDRYGLRTQKNVNTGNNFVKFNMPSSRRIPLIIGDAIHNLRSALDILIYEIIIMNGKILTSSEERSISFPFRNTRDELVTAINNGIIQTIGIDLINVIVDIIKPYYSGGNNSLCALNKLDIIDKHRLLLSTVSVASGVNSNIDGLGTLINCIFVGGTHNFANIPINANIENQGKPTFDILFTERDFFQNQPVVPTLHQLSQLVSGIIDSIEECIVSRK